MTARSTRPGADLGVAVVAEGPTAVVTPCSIVDAAIGVAAAGLRQVSSPFEAVHDPHPSRHLSYLVGDAARPSKLTSYLAPLLRAGLIAGIVVAAVAFPLVAIGGLGRPGRHRLHREPAGRARRPRRRPGHLRLRRRRQDADHPVLRGVPQVRPARRDLARTCSRRSWPARTRGSTSTTASTPRASLRAFVANQQAGGVSQGASTLTMQYVRNVAARLGRDPAARCTRRPSRPTGASCARCAWRWRWRSSMTKEQILERYLNVAYFGHRAYGIYAAAEVYFSKQPEGPDPGRGGHARRPGQGALRVRPGRPDQQRRAGPAQLRDRPDGRARVRLRRTGRAGQEAADRAAS